MKSVGAATLGCEPIRIVTRQLIDAVTIELGNGQDFSWNMEVGSMAPWFAKNSVKWFRRQAEDRLIEANPEVGNRLGARKPQ